LTNVVRNKGTESAIDDEEFKRESGIGVVISEDDIANFVSKLFEENAENIKELGQGFDFSKLIYRARDELKWAD